MGLSAINIISAHLPGGPAQTAEHVVLIRNMKNLTRADVLLTGLTGPFFGQQRDRWYIIVVVSSCRELG